MNNIDTRKASKSITEATVSLLDAVDVLFMVNPKGAANFCACSLKVLGPRSSPGQAPHFMDALRAFHEHSSKIYTRRIYKIYRS